MRGSARFCGWWSALTRYEKEIHYSVHFLYTYIRDTEFNIFSTTVFQNPLSLILIFKDKMDVFLYKDLNQMQTIQQVSWILSKIFLNKFNKVAYN